MKRDEGLEKMGSVQWEKTEKGRDKNEGGE